MVAQAPIVHKPSVSGPRQQAWIRALDRARLVATRKPTYCCGKDHFKVYSERAGNTYTVCPVLDDGELTYHCDCQAGMNGQICWHAALVAALPQEVARRAKHREERRGARAEVAAMAGQDFADWLYA